MLSQPIDKTSLDSVLELNNRHAEELSYLQISDLKKLVDMAFYARRVGMADALMIAFDQDAKYASPNFLWLKQTFARFIYVDRIAVAASARGRGLARSLYEELFAQSLEAGHDTVCCEVNADPPNPASDAFHAALQFKVIGQQTLPENGKTVRYFARKMRHLAAGL
jgi:uncharacterized protein